MAFPGCCMPSCGEAWLNALPANCNTPQCYCPICAVNKGLFCTLLNSCWQEDERTDAVLYVNVTCANFNVNGLTVPSDEECGIYSTPGVGGLAAPTAQASTTLSTTTTGASNVAEGANQTGGPGANAAAASHHGLTTGQKAGIGVGVGVGVPLLLALIFLLFCCCRRRRRRDAGGAAAPIDEKEASDDSSDQAGGLDSMGFYGAAVARSKKKNGAAGGVGKKTATATESEVPSAYAEQGGGARRSRSTKAHNRQSGSAQDEANDDQFIAGNRGRKAKLPGNVYRHQDDQDIEEQEGDQHLFGGGARRKRKSQGNSGQTGGEHAEDDTDVADGYNFDGNYVHKVSRSRKGRQRGSASDNSETAALGNGQSRREGKGHHSSGSGGSGGSGGVTRSQGGGISGNSGHGKDSDRGLAPDTPENEVYTAGQTRRGKDRRRGHGSGGYGSDGPGSDGPGSGAILTGGHASGGHRSSGYGYSAHGSDGHGFGGSVSGGNAAGGYGSDGHASGSHESDGHGFGGLVSGGHAAGSHGPDGPASGGHGSGGHESDGHGFGGLVSGGQAAGGYGFDGHASGGHGSGSYGSGGRGFGVHGGALYSGSGRGRQNSGRRKQNHHGTNSGNSADIDKRNDHAGSPSTSGTNTRQQGLSLGGFGSGGDRGSDQEQKTGLHGDTFASGHSTSHGDVANGSNNREQNPAAANIKGSNASIKSASAKSGSVKSGHQSAMPFGNADYRAEILQLQNAREQQTEVQNHLSERERAGPTELWHHDADETGYETALQQFAWLQGKTSPRMWESYLTQQHDHHGSGSCNHSYEEVQRRLRLIGQQSSTKDASTEQSGNFFDSIAGQREMLHDDHDHHKHHDHEGHSQAQSNDHNHESHADHDHNDHGHRLLDQLSHMSGHMKQDGLQVVSQNEGPTTITSDSGEQQHILRGEQRLVGGEDGEQKVVIREVLGQANNLGGDASHEPAAVLHHEWSSSSPDVIRSEMVHLENGGQDSASINTRTTRFTTTSASTNARDSMFSARQQSDSNSASSAGDAKSFSHSSSAAQGAGAEGESSTTPIIQADSNGSINDFGSHFASHATLSGSGHQSTSGESSRVVESSMISHLPHATSSSQGIISDSHNELIKQLQQQNLVQLGGSSGKNVVIATEEGEVKPGPDGGSSTEDAHGAATTTKTIFKNIGPDGNSVLEEVDSTMIPGQHEPFDKTSS